MLDVRFFRHFQLAGVIGKSLFGAIQGLALWPGFFTASAAASLLYRGPSNTCDGRAGIPGSTCGQNPAPAVLRVTVAVMANAARLPESVPGSYRTAVTLAEA